MSSTPQFAHCDTKKPDGFYVQFKKLILQDCENPRPDEYGDGFWPEQDSDAAGYVPPEKFDSEMRKAKRRMAAWERGKWSYIGVRARALCFIVRNGVGTYINLDSPGTFGVESDAGKYLDSLYAEQIEELKDMLAAMQNPIYEDSTQ